MKYFSLFLFGLLMLCVAPLAYAADQNAPITRDDIEAIAKAASDPALLMSLEKTEALINKTVAPNAHMRLVAEGTMSGVPIPKMDKVFDRDGMINAARGGAVNGLIYTQPPKSTVEILRFSYDPEKKQADYIYKQIVEGEMAAIPNAIAKTQQICRAVDERQVDGSIMSITGSCTSKSRIMPVAGL